jgi:hypothetical protein
VTLSIWKQSERSRLDDDEPKTNSIINTLTRTAGEGNFHDLAGFGPPDIFDE